MFVWAKIPSTPFLEMAAWSSASSSSPRRGGYIARSWIRTGWGRLRQIRSHRERTTDSTGCTKPPWSPEAGLAHRLNASGASQTTGECPSTRRTLLPEPKVAGGLEGWWRWHTTGGWQWPCWHWYWQVARSRLWRRPQPRRRRKRRRRNDAVRSLCYGLWWCRHP